MKRPLATLLVSIALIPALRAQAPTIQWSVPAHAGGVNDVAFSPDGQFIATAGADHTVKLWQASTGAPIRTLTTFFGEASTVSFSGNGTLLAAGDVENNLRVLLLPSGDVVCEQFTTGFVRDVALSPQGDKLAVALGYFSNDFDIFDVASCQLQSILTPNDGTIWSTAWSANGAWLATGGADGDTVVMVAETGQQVLNLDAHQDDVSAVDFAPDGSLVASAGMWDHRVLVWSVPGGAPLLDLTAPNEFLHDLDISDDGTLLAVAGELYSVHGSIRLWTLPQGQPLAVYAEGLGSNVLSVGIAPDDESLAFGRADGELVLASVPGGFTAVGMGLAGSAGVPTLSGTGDTSAGSATGFTLSVAHAAPSAPGLLFASTQVGSQPLLGGTLYAWPVVAQVALQASPGGTLELAASVPAGTPAGLSLVVQAWFLDVTAPKGASASNGLQFTVLPPD